MPPRISAKGAKHSFDAAPTPTATTNTDLLLFSGLHFYFFPNSRTNRGRALRIDKAIQHGANFCQQLNPKVTHVIMDDGMHWDEFTKYHKDLSLLPENVIIVNGRYIADCLAYGIILAPAQRVYEISGRASISAESSKLKRIASEPTLAEKAKTSKAVKLQRSKTDQGSEQNKAPREPTQEYNSIVSLIGRGATAVPKVPVKDAKGDKPAQNEDTVYKDDLSAMIDETKATAHLVCDLQPLRNPALTFGRSLWSHSEKMRPHQTFHTPPVTLRRRKARFWLPPSRMTSRPKQAHRRLLTP